MAEKVKKTKKKKADDAEKAKAETIDASSEEDAQAAAQPDEEESSSVETPAEETEKLQDRIVRLQADFENYRKRVIRERSEETQRATEQLIEEMLPALDHFEMGLETAEKHAVEQSVCEGFLLVYEQLLGALGKFGLQQIKAEGEAFDPHRHEAIAHLPGGDVPADHIISQTRHGYMLGQKLLRPAQVVVSSGSQEETPQSQPEHETEVPDDE